MRLFNSPSYFLGWSNGKHLNDRADNMRSADSDLPGVFNAVLCILPAWRNYGRHSGTVARKLGKATAWGAKYDSAADILFALAALIRIIGSVDFPLWLLLWIGTIAFIKAANMIAGFLRYHRFTAVHSVWNKVCGVAVFLSPLFIGAECAWQAKAPAAMAVCVIASIAAVQESVCIAKGGRAE